MVHSENFSPPIQLPTYAATLLKIEYHFQYIRIIAYVIFIEAFIQEMDLLLFKIGDLIFRYAAVWVGFKLAS